MTIAAIIVAFLVSTVGLSIFVYGKRQRRAPQLVAGVLMMACPFLVPAPVWDALAGAAVLLALRVAIDRGV